MSASFEQNLRRHQTDAEQRLWYHLRNRNLGGWKFRRQHRIGPYVVDFVCLEAGVAVELDGGQHQDALAYDECRTTFLKTRGLRVLRFWDNEVLKETTGVLAAILEALDRAGTPHPSPLPTSGEPNHSPDSRFSPSPPEGGRGQG